MIVLEVEALAFGPFAKGKLVLGPRMNVIYGPNETGKSSLHAAIYAGICGRRRAKGPGTKVDREFAENHKPWAGKGWAVRIVLKLQDGRTIELLQVLDDPASSRVVDTDTGRDVTEEFLSDAAPDASQKLGLSRATMFATSTVRQAEIRRVHEESEALQGQLQAATTVAGADRSAQAAIERITQFLRENVGLRRANATKPLQTAINQVRESEKVLEEAVAAHEAYLDLQEAREAAAAEHAACTCELQKAQQTLSRLKLKRLQDRTARAQKLAGNLPEGEAPVLEVLQQEVKSIRQVVTRFEERPEEPEVPVGASAEALERNLADLPELPVGDLEPSTEVESARENWRSALGAAQAHEKYRPQAASDAEEVAASGGELRRLATALEASAPEPDREAETELAALYGRRRAPFWKVGARAMGAVMLVGAAGMAAMGLATPWWIAAGVVGMLALACGFLPQRDLDVMERRIRGLEALLAAQRVQRADAGEKRQGAEARLAELGLPAEPEYLRPVAQRQEAAATTRKEIEDWEEERNRLQKALSALHQEMTEALVRRMGPGAEEAADLEARYRQYEQQCRERASVVREAEKASGLADQLRTRKALEESVADVRARRASAEAAVVELAAKLDIETEDVEAAVVELRSRGDAQAADYDRWNQAREDLAKLEEVLRGKTVRELEEEVEALAGVLADDLDHLEPVDLGEDPEATLEAIRARRNEARGRLDRLTGQIENQEHDLKSVAEAQEALEQAKAKLDRVERLQRTLEMTRTLLEDARESVQRDLAPYLRSVLETNLEAVTGGRYKEARVDPANLEVTVRTADGEWHSADRLSHGTMEQVYLLLRVALVRYICSAGEPSPIFLDDPTVQSDSGRTLAILDVLEQLSEDHQVILFSQEEEVHEWAQAREGSTVRIPTIPTIHSGAKRPVA